ncbi:MAG TPA: beta/gamma crystallin-related protein [Casimicrobiaceae bacterium]|nr:beta/gamma crystallin-related protein [Casimicrobiaceae bacterium]
MRPTFLPWLLAAAASLAAPAAQSAVAILFEHQNFEGQRMTVRNAMRNLDRTEFNDRAESILIQQGTWEVCTDAYYRGRCERLGPGEYRSLSGELTRSISSLHEVRGAPPPAPRPVPPSGRPIALLYDEQNFGGRQFIIEDQVIANFEGNDFNDRAASLRIEGGYWLFCTDAYFHGTCRTFGPGEYPQLPPDMTNRISSGRRIHEQYPPPGGQR